MKKLVKVIAVIVIFAIFLFAIMYLLSMTDIIHSCSKSEQQQLLDAAKHYSASGEVPKGVFINEKNGIINANFKSPKILGYISLYPSGKYEFIPQPTLVILITGLVAFSFALSVTVLIIYNIGNLKTTDEAKKK